MQRQTHLLESGRTRQAQGRVLLPYCCKQVISTVVRVLLTRSIQQVVTQGEHHLQNMEGEKTEKREKGGKQANSAVGQSLA